jgi:CheY-like chemotaxis protein
VLFTEFTRVGANKRKIGEGAGLGLAICKQLAGLMKGRVGVQSQPGEGATFWFEAPLDPARAVSDTAKEKTGEMADFRKLLGYSPRVLVAEDVPTNQMLIRMSLEGLGCRVTIVNNGVEAVDAAKTHTYDVVFMDIAMPEMDGTTATARIMDLLGPDKAPPIYALTAHGMDEDREEFAAAGMCGIVTKPFKRQDLYDAVEEAVVGAPVKEEKTGDMEERDTFDDKPDFDVDLLDGLMLALDSESQAMLLGQCQSDLASNLELLSNAIDAGTPALVAEAAHRIKSVSGTFGLTRVQFLANEANNGWLQRDGETCMAYGRMIRDFLPDGIEDIAAYQGRLAVGGERE